MINKKILLINTFKDTYIKVFYKNLGLTGYRHYDESINGGITITITMITDQDPNNYIKFNDYYITSITTNDYDKNLDLQFTSKVIFNYINIEIPTYNINVNLNYLGETRHGSKYVTPSNISITTLPSYLEMDNLDNLIVTAYY